MATPAGIARALKRTLSMDVVSPAGPARTPGRAILLNPRRLEIILAAATYPGMHLREASRLLLAALPTLRHHVSRLRTEGLLTLRRRGRRVHLFLPSLFPERYEDFLVAWEDPSSRKVLRALSREGALDRRGLARASSLSLSVTDRAIRRLELAGAVRRVPRGTASVFRLSPAWRGFERSCRSQVAARLGRFLRLLARAGLRPEAVAVTGDRARIAVDAPRGRLRFLLPVNPLTGERAR